MKKNNTQIFSRWRLCTTEWERNKHTTRLHSALQTNTMPKPLATAAKYQPLQHKTYIQPIGWYIEETAKWNRDRDMLVVYVQALVTYTSAPIHTSNGALRITVHSYERVYPDKELTETQTRCTWKSSEKKTSQVFPHSFLFGNFESIYITFIHRVKIRNQFEYAYRGSKRWSYSQRAIYWVWVFVGVVLCALFTEQLSRSCRINVSNTDGA